MELAPHSQLVYKTYYCVVKLRRKWTKERASSSWMPGTTLTMLKGILLEPNTCSFLRWRVPAEGAKEIKRYETEINGLGKVTVVKHDKYDKFEYWECDRCFHDE